MSKQKFNSGGAVSLSSPKFEGSLLKRTMLCHTGTFDGVFGPVEVTAEKLSRIAERYNKQRAKPQNENDYAPILLDHNRDVRNIQGRVMTGLEVSDWVDPETGVTEQGLYGDLRVDTEEGRKNVDLGIFSQVSISFDEETDELFECSFVAVEAARRSQVLSQGEKNQMDLKQLETQVASLGQQNAAILAKVKAHKALRQAQHVNLSAATASLESEIKEMLGATQKGVKALKIAALKGQLRGFVLLGKMKKTEFDALDVASFAEAPKAAIDALLKSYSDRAASTDLVTFGQSGTNKPEITKLGAQATRTLIEAQKKGLAAPEKPAGGEAGGEGSGDDKSKPDANSTKPGPAESPGEMSMGDIDEHVKAMEGVSSAVEKCMGYMKSMHESLKKFMEPDAEADGA